MKDKLQYSMHVVSYFLWQYTDHENALDLWNCTKDIVKCLESDEINHLEDVMEIRSKSKYDYAYIRFVRNIAYRIYVFTNNKDSATNWHTAEKLIRNEEWVTELINLVHISRELKEKNSQT